MRRLLKTWEELFSTSSYTGVFKAIARYMRFKNSISQFQLLPVRPDGSSPRSQESAFVDIGGPLKSGEGVFTALLDRSVNTNETLRNISRV